MTKDLFAIAFAELSNLDRVAYDQEYIERLPFLMIRTAAESFPATTKLKGFSELYDFLEAESPKHWNNPELYTHLLLLHNSDSSISHRQVHVLRTHLGLTPPDADSFYNSRFLRIKCPQAYVVELRDGRPVTIDDVVLEQKNGRPGPLIYCPYPNLFDDIAREVYAGADSEMDLVDLGILVKKAIAELDRYCPHLAAAFCKTMGTIAFTGGTIETSARSYSAELSYLGGMFTLIAANNLPALVENFIHEYYHSRLWAWWLIEKPSDLPPRELTIVSPVTHTRRPVVVMMQASLIYAGVIDYYRFVLADSGSYESHVLDEAKKRLHTLEKGRLKLIDSLDRALRDRPKSRRFATFVSSVVKSRSLVSPDLPHKSTKLTRRLRSGKL